ncbi:MAG: PAS domain S-box protein, partial [Gammaproteobacteria bacterium]
MRSASTSPEALYDDAPCGLLLADADGLLLQANATACAWLGFTLPELAGMVRIQDLMTVGARLFHHTHCVPVLQARGSVAELQIDLRHRDGTRLPMLVNIARRHDGDEVRDQWALFMATERQSYERELRNARRAAEEAVASRIDLWDGINADIGTRSSSPSRRGRHHVNVHRASASGSPVSRLIAIAAPFFSEKRTD